MNSTGPTFLNGKRWLELRNGAHFLKGWAHTVKIQLGQLGERDASHPDGEWSGHKPCGMAKMINAIMMIWDIRMIWDMLSVRLSGSAKKKCATSRWVERPGAQEVGAKHKILELFH